MFSCFLYGYDLPFLLFFWRDNKLLQKKQIDLQNKKKKSSQKKNNWISGAYSEQICIYFTSCVHIIFLMLSFMSY
jgi:hypothetical protein